MVNAVLLTALRASNEEREVALKERGWSVNGLQTVYLISLLETILGVRLQDAELLYEQRKAEALDSCEADAARQAEESVLVEEQERLNRAAAKLGIHHR